ncbi:MAG: lipid-A-disaccharide synthase [Oleibacter sp.]|nr:lipid-A-disaccharide synthase [Thalassolituus sp.]
MPNRAQTVSQQSTRPLTIALVAGEISGDMIGAGLISQLRERYPNAVFEGIGGPLMEAEGMTSFYPMERLSVMGLFEVLGRIFELLRIRKALIQGWLRNPPDVFIGIDAPDFNLTLEEKLRASGIKTAHYVSPSVWAWRQKRVLKIARAVDVMLTLFPFEADFYKDHAVPVRFVGHHLADKIALETPKLPAREALGLPSTGKIICLMPGSRGSEIQRLGAIFRATAVKILNECPDAHFIIPAANSACYEQINTMFSAVDEPSLPFTIVQGRSRECMAAADVILLASGTATLEAMLIKRPMVVSYILAPLTYQIVKRLIKQSYISLPNLLAKRELVPEILQNDATPERLSQALLLRLQDTDVIHETQQTFLEIHQSLRLNADQKAADAIVELLSKDSINPAI